MSDSSTDGDDGDPVDGDAGGSVEASVAVAHEHYLERGGAERVAEEIARTFGAEIFTGFIKESALPSDSGNQEFIDLFGDSITAPIAKRSRWYRDFYYQFAWQRRPELVDFDVVVQSGNNPGWYVPPEDQAVVKYVHTTPRTAYDRFQQRAADLPTKLYAHAARVLYAPNVPYPDVYVANSELVARRIRRYWGVEDVRVVYPPVDVNSYEAGEGGDYFLAYSRLTEEKRLGEVMEAFRELPGERLVVGGSGPQESGLRALAADIDNVEFRGYLTEPEKRELLENAKAVVYAAVNEDFGLVPVEAYASGTPVVGVRDGYTRYQVEDGVTGVLFDRGVDELTNAIQRFLDVGVRASPGELVEVAETYGVEQFRSGMRAAVRAALEAATIEAGPRR